MAELKDMAERLRGVGDKGMCLGFEVRNALGDDCCICPMNEDGSAMTCKDCRVLMRGKLADALEAAQELPEGVEWPRFEDGGLVRFGDEFEHGGVKTRVTDVEFRDGKTAVWGGVGTDDPTVHVDNEPLKRPGVKDRDGKTIKKGDTVWGEDGREWLVTGLLRDKNHCVVALSGGKVKMLKPEWLTHSKPDSHAAIDTDAAKDPCEYFNGRTPDKCADCKLHADDEGFDFDVQFAECRTAMARDLLARQRKLMGGE